MTDIITTGDPKTVLRFATADDVGLIIDFISQLADYDKMVDEVVADEDQLRQSLLKRPLLHPDLGEYGRLPGLRQHDAKTHC